MLKRVTLVLLVVLLGLLMTASAYAAAAETQAGSIPWWAWLLIVLAFLMFLGIVIWWCLSTPEEAIEERAPVEHELEAPAETIAPAVEVAAPTVEAAAPAIDLGVPEVELRGPEVAAPAVDVELPELEAEAPAIEAEPPELEAETPTIAVDLPELEVEASTIAVDFPELEVRTRSVDVEAAEMDMDLAGVEEGQIGPQPSQADDLKIVEGIGPKIESVLHAAGIRTFAELAATPADRIDEILAAESTRLASLADPTTWPEQAQLAAEGKWAVLEQLQDELKGGRREGPRIE